MNKITSPGSKLKRGDFCVLNKGSGIMRVTDNHEGLVYVQLGCGRHAAVPHRLVRPHVLTIILGPSYGKLVWDFEDFKNR